MMSWPIRRRCPFHRDLAGNSLHVFPSGRYVCVACDAHGQLRLGRHAAAGDFDRGDDVPMEGRGFGPYEGNTK